MNIDSKEPGFKEPTQGAPAQPSMPSPDSGIQLGSGVVRGLLGVGGMGRVYKVWNERLEMFRAVKILLPTASNDQLHRFDTEAKISAKLNHPNIVEVHGVGEWNAMPYLEMEFVEGETLQGAIKRVGGGLPIPVCTGIGIMVARALHYAHHHECLVYGTRYHGIIHRDIKPANVMLSSEGNAKLLDFGMARPAQMGLHTMAGVVVGTVNYLSPEQINGEKADPRSDIYALGEVLYEMITGVMAYPQRLMPQLLTAKSTGNYIPLENFTLKIPQKVSQIVTTCLALEPSDRYSDAAQVLRALEEAHSRVSSRSPEEEVRAFVSAGAPTSSAGISVSYTPSTSRRKRAGILLNTLMGAAAAVGVLGIALWISMGKVRTPAVVSVSPDTVKVVLPSTESETESVAGRRREPLDESLEEGPVSTMKRLSHKREPELVPESNTVPRNQGGVSEPASAAPSASSALAEHSDVPDEELLKIAGESVARKEFTAVIALLEKADFGDETEALRRDLYLLESYVETRQMDKVEIVTARIDAPDGQLHYLRGRIHESAGRESDALEEYRIALTHPSAVRSPHDIRRDALFRSAQVHERIYSRDKSSEARIQALNSWTLVKQQYERTPDHVRFRMALQKVQSIGE